MAQRCCRRIGGENTINPPHLARAVFAAYAEGLQPGAPELLARLDQPWGKADLYFSENLCLILRTPSS